MAPTNVHLILYDAGQASRRGSLRLLASGRVAINGVVVGTNDSSKGSFGGDAPPVDVARELRDVTADLDKGDVVTLDGVPMRPRQTRMRYVLVDKPRGVLCACDDSRGWRGKQGDRPLITSVIPPELGVSERLGHAGRLDLDSEGLVLMTNDREVMAAITQNSRCPKSYDVTVVGIPERQTLDRLRNGAFVGGMGRLLPCDIAVLGVTRPTSSTFAMSEKAEERRSSTRLRVTLREGKNRQIRRMFSSVGHSVLRLVRTSVGPLSLDSLRTKQVVRSTEEGDGQEWDECVVGGARELEPEEVEELKNYCETSLNSSHCS